MGMSHSYKCEKCHKHATASFVSTEGMRSKVKAMKCNDCGEISDCVIALKSEMHSSFRKITPCCEACASENVVKWDGKCPECDIPMINDGMCMLWD